MTDRDWSEREREDHFEAKRQEAHDREGDPMTDTPTPDRLSAEQIAPLLAEWEKERKEHGVWTSGHSIADRMATYLTILLDAVESLQQERADVNKLHESVFMKPLLSREYPDFDPPELRGDDGHDLGLDNEKAMRWLVQRSHDAESAERQLTEAQAKLEQVKALPRKQTSWLHHDARIRSYVDAEELDAVLSQPSEATKP